MITPEAVSTIMADIAAIRHLIEKMVEQPSSTLGPDPPLRPKRGRMKGSRIWTKVDMSPGTTEAEIRAQARCINPTTGAGCGKLLSECTCGVGIPDRKPVIRVT